MKYLFLICLNLFLFTNVSFSQEKTITHKVGTTETIVEIAQKYQVTPYEIYQLNPDAQKRLKPNMVLLIPSKSGVKTTTKAPVSKYVLTTSSHEVMPKETMYGIQKKYNVTEEELKKANPFLEEVGLQIGQVLVVPNKKQAIPTVASNSNKLVYHVVLPKETKYSISKQYGITIEELEKRNPEIIPNLTIGYNLLIKGTPDVAKTVKAVEPLEVRKTVLNPLAESLKNEVYFTSYVVKPQETLYSLSKMFDISQEELIKLNPTLTNGVAIGMMLKVPSKNPQPKVEKKEFASLSKIIAEGKRKRLVMLLPFNVDADSDISTSNRIKKDKFLNMTLDFYAGALMAIDSAKVLGLPIDIEIYDSQENKYGSSVPELIEKHQLQTANAIIGPFYQSNAEIAATILKVANTPVISPLSKDVGNPYRNLYQTIPSPETVKGTMFDFMRANNGNIMAVVDKKKESIIKYIKEYQKGVPFVTFTDRGSVSVESFKSLLVKDKMNYVVMETANTWMIKTTISMMLSVRGNYQVQLVILEPNETLDFEEIKFDNLIKLKLMYPSVTRENVSNEAIAFENNFKRINNIYPDTYATRGFDVTFDTMMRLVQDVKFEETVNTVATKQVDSQFEYYLKSDGGYTNKGVFILYYDEDLTIKEAK